MTTTARTHHYLCFLLFLGTKSKYIPHFLYIHVSSGDALFLASEMRPVMQHFPAWPIKLTHDNSVLLPHQNVKRKELWWCSRPWLQDGRWQCPWYTAWRRRFPAPHATYFDMKENFSSCKSMGIWDFGLFMAELNSRWGF